MAIAFASHNTHQQVKCHIKNNGYQLIEIRPLNATYEAADTHADLYFHNLGGTMFYASQASGLLHSQLPDSILLSELSPEIRHFPEELEHRKAPRFAHASCNEHKICIELSPPDMGAQAAGLRIEQAAKPLQAAYPGNIALNAVSTAKFFIHNLRYTDPALLRSAEEAGLTLVHVRQGYTKCSVAIVSDDAFITSDAGIAKALRRQACQVLEIQAGYVELPGLPYGFFGGASGLLGNELTVNGDLNRHPDCSAILEFCREHKTGLRFFPGLPLVDIGSIITF